MIIHRVTANVGEIHLLVSKLKLLSEDVGLRDDEACRILRMPPGSWPITAARVRHWKPEAWVEKRLRRLVDVLEIADRLLGEGASDWLRAPNPGLFCASPVRVLIEDAGALAQMRAVLVAEDRR